MSKKEEAFELFSQGKRPSSPEVKALGLAAKSRYNYFLEWKKLSGELLDSTDFNEINDLKAEKARLTLLTQIKNLEAKRDRLPERVGRLERDVRQIAKWLDENRFEDDVVIFFIANCLGAIRQGRTIDEYSVNDMMEDAEKKATRFEQEKEKYIDRMEAI